MIINASFPLTRLVGRVNLMFNRRGAPVKYPETLSGPKCHLARSLSPLTRSHFVLLVKAEQESTKKSIRLIK